MLYSVQILLDQSKSIFSNFKSKIFGHF